MAHHTLKSAYDQFVARLNRFPQGAPPSETLFKILKVLFSEEEARLMAFASDQAVHRSDGGTGVEERRSQDPAVA